MMRLMILFLTFSLCSCIQVQRPNSYVWGINGVSKTRRGYNVRTDYDDSGIRKPGATPVTQATSLTDLNGALCFLPQSKNDDGINGIKIWLGDSRNWAKEHCK